MKSVGVHDPRVRASRGVPRAGGGAMGGLSLTRAKDSALNWLKDTTLTCSRPLKYSNFD
jgi:hypothetical protein